jgi:hypothetical protein
VAAILLVGLVALRFVPTLLHAPEPPPLGRDVGLPRAKPVRIARAPVERKEHRKAHRRTVPDAPAATAHIGTKTRHRHKHRHLRKHRSPPPEPPPTPVEPSSPPTPEYAAPPSAEPAPEPPPTPLPEPPPAPESVPGDGSQEFAPH